MVGASRRFMASQRSELPSSEDFRRDLLVWGRDHRRAFPWRESNDPFRVMVGELLLQRTRGENVAAVYEELLRRWPTPAKLSRARRATIARVVQPLGLAKRADLIVRFAKVLQAQFDGRIPHDPEVAERLPGVGPYSSRAVQVFARGRNLPLADWVIARVLRRYFGLPSGKRPNADKELWTLAASLADAGRARDLWLVVLDLGAQICKPRPKCGECPLRSTCSFAAEETHSPQGPDFVGGLG